MPRSRLCAVSSSASSGTQIVREEAPVPPHVRPGDCGRIWGDCDDVELNAASDDWCQGDAGCRLAKEQAILPACEKGLNGVTAAAVALLRRLDIQRVPQARPCMDAAGVSIFSLRQQITEGLRELES